MNCTERPAGALIDDRHITCEPDSRSLWPRVAICWAEGPDLGADMVADGHAWAFVPNSRDYVEEEREAAECGPASMVTHYSLHGCGERR